jgi:hypothetical protein
MNSRSLDPKPASLIPRFSEVAHASYRTNLFSGFP